MAVYRYNPGDSTIGAGVPTGLTSRWDSSGVTIEVIEDLTSPSGKALEIVVGGTAQRVLLSIDAVNADADRETFEAICLIEPLNKLTTSTYGGLAGRCTGNGSAETGRAGVMASTGTTAGASNMRNNHYTGGTGSVNNGDTVSWTAGTKYWLLVQMNGSDFTSSLFAANDPLGTPLAAPYTTVANASNADDWIGVFAFSADTQSLFHYVGIATGADTASSALPLAPVISTPTGVETGSTTADLGFTPDYAGGTGYVVVTTSATQPSEAQIIAGQDHTGAAAAFSSNSAITTTSAKTFSATGLTPEEIYYAHFLKVDPLGEQSNRISSTSFTMDAGAPATYTLIVDELIYTSAAGDTLYTDTGLELIVLSGAYPRSIVYQTNTGAITSGVLEIVDAAFETPAEQFVVLVLDLPIGRPLPATVVEDV